MDSNIANPPFNLDIQNEAVPRKRTNIRYVKKASSWLSPLNVKRMRIDKDFANKTEWVPIAADTTEYVNGTIVRQNGPILSSPRLTSNLLPYL